MPGPLTIWEDPIPDEEYTVSWDPALGLRADYAEGFVIKHAPLTVVAHYRSNRVKPDRAGVIAYLLALYYNGARLVVERTGCGVATLTILENGHPEYPQMGTGYPNLVYETPADKKSPDESDRLGVGTSRKMKEAKLGRLAEYYDAGQITIWSKPLLEQMSGFCWDAERENWVQNHRDPLSGLKNDDGIMALAFGIWDITEPRKGQAAPLKLKAAGW
jgi:hypothetical protein